MTASSTIICTDETSLEDLDLDDYSAVTDAARFIALRNTFGVPSNELHKKSIFEITRSSHQDILYVGSIAERIGNSVFKSLPKKFRAVTTLRDYTEIEINQTLARRKATRKEILESLAFLSGVEKIVYVYGEEHKLFKTGNSGNFAFLGWLDQRAGNANFIICKMFHAAKIIGIPVYIIGKNECSINYYESRPIIKPPFSESIVRVNPVGLYMALKPGHEQKTTDLLRNTYYANFNKIQININWKEQ